MVRVLHQDAGNPTVAGFYASDRKFRLFACACCRMADSMAQREAADRYEESVAGLGLTEFEWARNWCASHIEGVAKSVRANLLREIIGNPFRPVVVPGWRTRKTDGSVIHHECPWLTPQVLTLAQAAYDERPGRRCEHCTGADGKALAYTGRIQGQPCPVCGATSPPYGSGTGRIDDGALDPFRLALVADALEEAGCESEELLDHLRGLERCPDCFDADEGTRVYCECGSRSGKQGWIPLRGPHVRGCWPLDLILGKE